MSVWIVRLLRWIGWLAWTASVGVVLCVLMLRALEYALGRVTGESTARALHYPLTAWIGGAFDTASRHNLENAIILIAAIAVQLILDGLASAGVIGPVPH
jgi:hypothetical protein